MFTPDVEINDIKIFFVSDQKIQNTLDAKKMYYSSSSARALLCPSVVMDLTQKPLTVEECGMCVYLV